MSNPIAPGAGSLEALIRDLVEKWNIESALAIAQKPVILNFGQGQAKADTFKKCADELEALLASAGRPPWQPIETEQSQPCGCGHPKARHDFYPASSPCRQCTCFRFHVPALTCGGVNEPSVPNGGNSGQVIQPPPLKE